MDLGLTERTYIVTGGTSGLGLAVARALVAEDAHVVVCSRDQGKVDDAVSELQSGQGKGQVLGVAADLTDPGTPGRLMEAARGDLGDLHGAFVSHGGPPPGPAEELDDDRLRQSLELATVAPIRFVREVAPTLPEGGSLLVLTSTSSKQPIPGLASSNVARPAVWAFVKTLSDELGPQGIRLNVLIPGRFTTDRMEQLEQNQAEERGVSQEEVRAETEEDIPLRRLGDPDELGRVAAFLLSPAASYVTGAAWPVDGGSLRSL